ncbi:MAG: beta-lactamase family protein [Ruminococcaceae bacterium]|nr:beta-lactamase family protein [Oscillospiraceae bacterium]
MLDTVKDFCDGFLSLGVPGFDLAVYRDGECIIRHTNGYSDLENKVRMTGKEKYNIYSCSKSITCTAALQLWEKGLFSLEDELSLYLPEFKEMTVKTEDGIKKADNPILIKHLFEMTAGLSYATSSPSIKKCFEDTNGRCPTRETIKYIANEPLLFEPGDRWHYSLCHDVLGALIEVISGEKFEDYLENHIFAPLGMNDTTFDPHKIQVESLAEQYRFKEGKAVNIGKNLVEYRLGRDYVSGGAGGVSTVDDYIKFLEGLRQMKLLKPETLTLMSKDRLTPHQKRTFWTEKTHGYGLGVRCPKEDKIYTDFGWGGAAGAYHAVDMENGLSLYLGMHLLSSPAQGLRTLIYRLVKAVLFGTEDFSNIQKEISALCDYNLTY